MASSKHPSPYLSSPSIPPSSATVFAASSSKLQSHPPTPILQSAVQSPVLGSISTNPHALRLLMPTVRVPRVPSQSPILRSPKVVATKRSSRAGIGAAGSILAPHDSPHPATDIGEQWIGKKLRFEIAQEHLELSGYQLYAVEKWVTERTRPVLTLAVYTGEPNHKITVTALKPDSHLSRDDTQAEWDAALRDLRQAGARPKQTGSGVLMVTSLANFRSDYTIVHIPSGFYLEARERLFTNINLLRMGCSGRTALTLEEPSDTTKDRFIGMYRVQDAIRAPALFSTTILELVRLVQAGLAIFGMYSLAPEERDGLLCDATVDGIQRWIAEIGEPFLNLEPMERIADPALVCALLSTVVTTRAKLSALGFTSATHGLPKDPFAEPARFRTAVSAFAQSRLCPVAGAADGVLRADVLDALSAAYDRSRQVDQFKLHRIAMHKIDELREGMAAGAGANGGSRVAAATAVDPTADMARFVRMLEKKGKEGVPSLRYLWSGRATVLREKEQEKEKERDRVLSDEEERYEKEKEKEGARREREKEEREGERTDEFSSASDADHRSWAGKKMQKTIEAWASRAKKTSIDNHQNRGPPGLEIESPRWQSPVPEVVISNPNEEEDILSSGQISPTSQIRLLEPGRATAATSVSNLSEFNRRLSELHDRRLARPTAQRITSWSDPRSAREMVYPGDSRESLGDSEGEIGHAREETVKATPDGRLRRRLFEEPDLERRWSFSDVARLSADPTYVTLTVDNMKIDVDICGQLLVLRRRAPHLTAVQAILRHLSTALSNTNAYLKDDYRAAREDLAGLEKQANVLGDTERARGTADVLAQEAQALSYETAQFAPAELWRTVAPQRHDVFALRRKLRGADGRALSGEKLPVDALGRTEDEAEEESALAGADDEAAEGDVEETAGERPPEPAWLLRVFERWTARWRKRTPEKAAGTQLLTRDDDPPSVQSTPAMSLDSAGRGKKTERTAGGEHAPWNEGTVTPPMRAYSPDSIVGFESD
ncbi:hypothetical protein K488DRAFT_67438 [Vararia minispora EC-137]|uniref:Uncharacterized protein n=1 Tax=Vararia minispora EC-137 TaxID=1314806 RepID=A0ACB8QYB6_9AGAM|nr:hypothetical protein K488DRAFT_67438 [Vararia minispora EC-137]